MIHTLSGKLVANYGNSLLIEVGGVGFKVFIPESVFGTLPEIGGIIRLYTFLYLREDHVALYGFVNERDLELFGMLNGISGIGPKTALGILGLTSTEKLLAAIKGGHAELLTKASGIGRKIAERIILELREKIGSIESGELVATMQSDADVIGALQNLGFAQRDAQEALQKVDVSIEGAPGRLKAALRLLKK
ncbi:MAG: Holliday junction branch migration protein RuvA [bacterium]|nr:Holliday junction branch migration protein RuvA [bacterium]